MLALAAPGAPWLPPAQTLAARTNGVAPLAVFFDASGATSAVSAVPFHELDFTWEFDNPASGTWSTDGRSRNAAYGPVAAHVFTSAGVHNVRLTVRDIEGGTSVATTAITVADAGAVFAGTNTVCVSASGVFADTPPGALLVTTAAFNALQAYIRPGVRILLRRGETWTATSGLTINNLGPGLIGSFGAGPPPRVVALTNFTFFTFSNRVPSCDDWRVTELELDGNNFGGTIAVSVGGTARRILLHALNVHDVHAGFVFADSVLDYNNNNGYPGHTLHDQLAITECVVERVIGGGGGNGAYIAARRLSLQGCQMHDSTGAEHILRTPWIQGGVIAHNAMSWQSPVKHLIKMHAPGFFGSGLGYTQHTERVIISDNHFLGNGAWSVTPGPQNATSDERVRDLIIERNHFVHSNNVQVSLVIWAQQVSVRNNIFDVSDGQSGTGISVTRRGIEPASMDVRIFHNTAVARTTRNLTLASIAAVVTNVTVINNLVSGLGGGTFAVNSGTGSGYRAASNIATASPLFVTNAPVMPCDFMPQAGSPAVNAGTHVPVYHDYNLTPRPVMQYDAGAFEYVPEPLTGHVCATAAIVTLLHRRRR